LDRDLALSIEHELFGEESLRIKLRQQYGVQFDGFAIEEALRRLKEQLFPLCERVNRQLL
jgi:DNA-directed RNA polymerase subunit L